MHQLKALMLALLALSLQLSASEQRIEFITLLDGTRLEQSEACFFPADEDDGFFKKFLSTNDVRCLSADDVISLPPGFFNVYARNGSTLVSAHPTFVDNSIPGEPAYRSVAVTLLPAAKFDVGGAQAGLENGEWLAVYIVNDSQPQSPASVHPVPEGETNVLVPAGMTVVPLVVRRGAIVRVGQSMLLRAGDVKTLAPPSQWGTGRDVVVLLRTDALTFSDVPVDPPRVELHGAGTEPVRPMVPLRPAGLFERSLAIFKDVPAGTYQVRLSGEGWQPDDFSVTTTAAPTAVTGARPLVARVSAIIEVQASIGELAAVGDVRCPNMEPSEASQDAPSEASPDTREKPTPVRSVPMMRLLHCEESGGASQCTAIRELSLDADQRDQTVMWADLAPGTYVVELSHMGLTQRSEQRDAAAGRKELITLTLQPEIVTGRVTHGGVPVRALVMFDHSLTPTLSDEAGNYAMVVTESPRRSVVSIILCEGGTYRFLPRDPIDKVLDIAIPKNSLVVRVSDEHGRPLANASVTGGLLFPEGDAEYAFLPFPATDKEGETQLQNIPTDTTLRLCATHPPDHDQGCAADFEIGDRASHRIAITLRGRETFRGKLLTNTPFVGGVIWLVAPTGAVLASAAVSEEGEFTLKRMSVPDAYLVTVSLSHPLVVFELPVTGLDQTPQFQMPAQSRTLGVTLSQKSPKRRVSLELAGRIVPTLALRRHQAVRRAGDIIEPGQTIEFRDLAGGPLAVYSVPYITDYPPEWTGLDPMEHPHLRSALLRFPATGPIVQIE